MEKFIRFYIDTYTTFLLILLTNKTLTDPDVVHSISRDALEDEDDLERVLKKAFLDADRALHTHLSYFNKGERRRTGKST